MIKDFTFSRPNGNKISGKFLSVAPEEIRDYKEGLDILLLHAFPISSDLFEPWYSMELWEDAYQKLANEVGRIRIIFPDLPGFGGSSVFSSDPTNLEMYVEAIGDVLDHFQVGKLILGGVSMGGYITLEFLRKYSGITKGIVLIDTRATADTEEGQQNRIRIAQKIKTAIQVYEEGNSFTTMGKLTSQSKEISDFHSNLLDKILGNSTQKTHRNRIENLITQQFGYSVAQAQIAMAGRSGTESLISNYNKPALIVVGAEDYLTPESDAKLMHDRLDNAQLKVIPMAGHLSPFENPIEFQKVFLDWINEQFLKT